MYEITSNTATNLGPVTKGHRFLQRFVARDDNLIGISVWAATYHKQIDSRAKITLLDETGSAVLREASADTSGFADNTWQRFAFEPVPESKGRTFHFVFETDAEGDAITLWTNSRFGEPSWRDGERLAEAICHKSHYLRSTHAVLDSVLAYHAASFPQPSPEQREIIHEIVRSCITQKEYYLLRLIHLLDGFDRTRDVTRILSIGSGDGFHEAFLAARFPHLRIDAVDVLPAPRDFGLPNLRFLEMDILRPTLEGGYDFVFSIECLEHIADYETAFRNMAGMARLGGYVYLSVPFASRREQQDEEMIKYVWEVAEHYTPGFDFETLDAYFAGSGLEVLHASNMFDCRLAHPLNALLHVMDTPVIEAVIEEVVRLFLLDLGDKRVSSMTEAEGIRYLGIKRAEDAAPPRLRAETAPESDETPAGQALRPATGSALAIDWANPGPLLEGVRAYARVRPVTDFFNAVSVRIAAAGQRVDSTATFTLYDAECRTELKKTTRRTLDFADGSWQIFPFESIYRSPGKTYCFSVETDAPDGAIALHPRPRASGPDPGTADGDIEFRAHYFPALARFLDPLLFRHATPPPLSQRYERYLDRHLFQCINLREYTFPRLMHLADAFGRIEEPVLTVLGVGVGMGYQEAFLAGRISHLHVLATDRARQMLDFPMANLQFELLDLLGEPRPEQFDLVFSVECLEHIEDYRSAFRTKAAMVKPGKYLYISVPFASREEQRDPALQRYVWEHHEHYTPGFTFEDLFELFEENELDVIHAANMFFCDLMQPLDGLVRALDIGALEMGTEEIARLSLLDLSDRRVSNMREAQGIRVLGRKRD